MNDLLPDLNTLRADLSSAGIRHNTRYRQVVASYQTALTRQFQMNLEKVLSFLVQNRDMAGINDKFRRMLSRAVLAEGKVVMDICELGPPLEIFPLNGFSHGLIAYGACGIMKIALASPCHPTETRPVMHDLVAMGFDAPTARAMGVMAAAAIQNAVVQTCLADRRTDIAEIMMRVSEQVSAGILTQSSSPVPMTWDQHETAIRQNDIPGHMMLEQIFLKTAPSGVRFQLLDIAANLHGLRHMMAIPDNGINRVQSLERLTERVRVIWENACDLNPACRDAVATRLLGSLAQLAVRANPIKHGTDCL